MSIFKKAAIEYNPNLTRRIFTGDFAIMGHIKRKPDTRTISQLQENIDYFANKYSEVAKFKEELKAMNPKYLSTDDVSEDYKKKELAILVEQAKNDPKNASLYYVEGNIRKQAGDKEKAVELYRQSVNANPDVPYDYGYIGEGILFYEEAMEFAEKAQNELDDNKYYALVKEYEASLQKALPPFEQAYNVCKDPGLRVEIAKYLRDINYRFREQDPKYQAAYDRFDAVVKSGQPD